MKVTDTVRSFLGKGLVESNPKLQVALNRAADLTVVDSEKPRTLEEQCQLAIRDIAIFERAISRAGANVHEILQFPTSDELGKQVLDIVRMNLGGMAGVGIALDAPVLAVPAVILLGAMSVQGGAAAGYAISRHNLERALNAFVASLPPEVCQTLIPQTNLLFRTKTLEALALNAGNHNIASDSATELT